MVFNPKNTQNRQISTNIYKKPKHPFECQVSTAYMKPLHLLRENGKAITISDT
jgi:hypothetical protein